MKGVAVTYSAEELAWISARRELPRKVLHEAFLAEFRRDDVSLTALVGLCKRRGWTTGRTGCFPKGNEPFNKGRKGYVAPGSEKGWFRKGNRTGRANHVHKPIGAERIAKGGYLQRKVNEDLPMQRRWQMVHVINWEAKNGPIPQGHALKCLDGDKLNTEPDNWELIPRAMLPRLAGAKKGMNYDHAPAELRPALLAAARLEHEVRVIRRERAET